MRNSQTPLTPREEDAFERLREVIGEMDEGCPCAAAVESVTECGFEDDEAVYLIKQFLLKGYLYTVRENIRATY